MRLGSLEAWGAGRELWAEERPREGRRDSPGVGSEGRVRTRPDSVQECVPSDVSSLKPESDRRVSPTPHPEPNSGTEGDSEPHPETKASLVRRTWQDNQCCGGPAGFLRKIPWENILSGPKAYNV